MGKIVIKQKEASTLRVIRMGGCFFTSHTYNQIPSTYHDLLFHILF